MKYILQIIDNVSADSGVSSVVMNLYRHIDKTKIQFDFLVCKEEYGRGKSYENEIRESGGQVVYFGSPLSVKTMRKASKAAKKFLRENIDRYEIVHLHTPTIALFTLRYAKMLGIENRIVHSHSTMTSKNFFKATINRVLISMIPRYANLFFACSSEAAAFLYGKNAVNEGKTKLIYNAVDAGFFRFSVERRKQTREKLGVVQNKVIVHISNFSPIKNHFFLIPIIDGLKKENRDIKFIFVGDGPTKQEFQEETVRKGISDICVFTGRMQDVSDILLAADIMVLPSIKEGLPVTVVEAQASGLPCMISDSITRECNVSDVKYMPLNQEKWIKGLLQMEPLSDIEREDRSNRFSESRFDIEKEAKRIEGIYLTL